MRRLMRAVRECWIEVSIAALVNGAALAGINGRLYVWFCGAFSTVVIAVLLTAVMADWLEGKGG